MPYLPNFISLLHYYPTTGVLLSHEPSTKSALPKVAITLITVYDLDSILSLFIPKNNYAIKLRDILG